LAREIMRGRALKARFEVNGIQNVSRSFGALVGFIFVWADMFITIRACAGRCYAL
jgi:hypothetical protein